MIKKIMPVVAMILAACDGGKSTGPAPCGGAAASITAPNFSRSSLLRAPVTARTSIASANLTGMNVGDVRVLDPADVAGGLTFQAPTTDRDYVVVVGNTDPQHDAVENFVVRGNQSSGASLTRSAPMPTFAVQASTVSMPGDMQRETYQRAIDRKVRSFERQHLSLKSSRVVPENSELSPRTSIELAGPCGPAVGDTISLKIPNTATTNLCNNFFSTKAVIAAVSRRAIIAIDTLDGNYKNVFPGPVLDSIATEFDNVTYPTDSAYYNTPQDIDANKRVIMLFSGQINKLTPANTPGGFVGGFFFAGDLFPATGTQAGSFCAESNRGEIFYLLSPDPTGRFGNVRSASSVRQGTRGTIAHEFQHMINAGNRFVNPAVNEFESTWLDEALAHEAEDAVGRAVRGFGVLQTLSFNDILPCNTPCAAANDFNAFFFQNLARLTDWMDKPDQFSPTSAMADTSLATRGAAWALVRYAADNFSGGDPRALTRKLAAGPDTGVVNFTAGTGASMDTLIAGWLVSMYADHQGIPNLNAKYQYKSYNFQSVMPPVAKSVLGQLVASYPLRITTIGLGTDHPATNRSGSGTYYLLPVPAGSTKTVQVLAPSGADANYPGEHVYVLRVQ